MYSDCRPAIRGVVATDGDNSSKRELPAEGPGMAAGARS